MSVILAAAVLAIGTVAFAQSQRAKAELTPLTIAGVTGQARLHEVQGGVQVQMQIRGLEPGVEYTAQWYQNTSCAIEAEVRVIETFTANPAGNANLSARLDRTLPEFGSISVVLSSENTVQACGQVVIE
jgi:hypothetical protein